MKKYSYCMYFFYYYTSLSVENSPYRQSGEQSQWQVFDKSIFWVWWGTICPFWVISHSSMKSGFKKLYMPQSIQSHKVADSRIKAKYHKDFIKVTQKVLLIIWSPQALTYQTLVERLNTFSVVWRDRPVYRLLSSPHHASSLLQIAPHRK